MGIMFYCKCEKCGYGFEANLGFGILYPVAYCEAVTKMKEGSLGEQGKEFFEAFPDGAISCEYIVVQCNECGKLMNVPKLDLYVPKDGYNASKQDKDTRWSVAFSGKGYDYVSPCDLDKYYDLFEQYNHRCTSCNGYASVVQGFTDCTDDSIDRHVQCPKCKSMLEIRPFGHWD